MAESSSQIPQRQEPIPQQEPNPQQQDQPESPILFEPATQTSSLNVALGKLSLYLLTNIRNICLSSDTLLELEDIITKLNKKTREKVVPYTRFLSLLLEYKIEGYGNDNVTLIPTQVFNVHNWALKKNQPKGSPFTDHMLAICKADVPVEHKAPNTSSYTRKKDSKGKKPRAKSRHRKQSTSSKHHPLSKIKATKCGSSKGMDEGTKNHSFDHLFTGTDPNALAKKSKSVSEGFKTVLNKPTTRKGASHIEQQIKEEFNTPPDLSSLDDAKQEIKLEDLSKLVQNMKAGFIDLDSPEDDSFIVVNESKEEEAAKEIHSQKRKLELEKNKAAAEVTLLSSQPSFPKVAQLTELLLKDLKEIPTKMENFTLNVLSLTTQVAELKTLQWELLAGFISIPTQGSTQPKRVHIKKYKGKKAMSSKDAEEGSSESDSDDIIHLNGSMVESSKKKKLKKFNFFTKDGDHVHLTEEQIKEQKKIEKSAKVKAAKQEA
ncbi:hypothetical protein Tco_1408841 [Tanacetum coccineum]